MQQTLEETFSFAAYDYLLLRIKKNMEPSDIQTWLDEITDKYIIGYEVATREHLHIMVGFPKTMNIDKSHQRQVRESLKKRFELIGNGDYAISREIVRNPSSAMQYTVKDGNILYKGFSDEFIEKIKKRSYQKFDKKEYNRELKNIKDGYIDGQYDVMQVIDRYTSLRSKYDMNCPDNQVLSVLRGILIRNSEYRERYNDYLYSKLL